MAFGTADGVIPDLDSIRRTVGVEGAISYCSRMDKQRVAWMQMMVKENRDLKAEKVLMQQQHTDKVMVLQESAHLAEKALEERVKRDQQWEERATAAEQSLRKLQETADADPFAVVLLDGDGYLFPDQSVRDGFDGGGKVAQRLFSAVEGYLEQFEGANRWSVVIRIFLNASGIATAYHTHKIIEKVAVMRDFTLGLARTGALFDILDVGPGKEQADHKLKENFTHFFRNMHCKHILVGCCHDNGYVPFLEAFNSDEMTSRISLIRHCGMGREYRRLRFNIASLEGLFRETNLPLHVEARLSNLKRTKTPSPEIDRRGSIWSTRVPIEPQGSYGGKGNRPDPRSFYILQLNKEGQRIDQKLPHARPRDFDIHDRRKRMQLASLCAFQYIFGECHKPSSLCRFSHDKVALDYGECLALGVRARDAYCSTGTQCRDRRCIYAHHCPYIGRCKRQERCNFANTHDMDIAPAVQSGDDSKRFKISH